MQMLNEYLPDLQIIALVLNAVLVLVVVPLRKSIDNLQISDNKMFERLAALEVKMAEKYVERDEIAREINKLDSKLGRIEAAVLAPKLDILRQQHRL